MKMFNVWSTDQDGRTSWDLIDAVIPREAAETVLGERPNTSTMYVLAKKKRTGVLFFVKNRDLNLTLINFFHADHTAEEIHEAIRKGESLFRPSYGPPIFVKWDVISADVDM